MLAADINKGCKNMCANPQSNWLNTIAMRASYTFYLFEAIFLVKTEKKTRGWSIFPQKKTKTETSLSF